MQALYYPSADRISQFFAGRYPGSKIIPNVLVLHTTETGTWPGYSGGASAPHFTVLVDRAQKRLRFRQHFPLNQSSRALRNLAGGVETNTLNAVQVELVGTCTKAYRDKYGYFYWPDAPDWVLQELGEFVRWLHTEWTAFPIKDAALRGWLAYGPDPRRPGIVPASYGASPARLTMAEWRKAYGILGHQHVPENVHGDPGDFNCARLVQYAKPEVKNPEPSGLVTQATPTLVQKARATLHQARKRALDSGSTNRAKRITEALRTLPKR